MRIVTILTAFFSDRFKARGIFGACVSVLSVAGWGMYLGEHIFPQPPHAYPHIPSFKAQETNTSNTVLFS